jgi:hypothetical protein
MLPTGSTSNPFSPKGAAFSCSLHSRPRSRCGITDVENIAYAAKCGAQWKVDAVVVTKLSPVVGTCHDNRYNVRPFLVGVNCVQDIEAPKSRPLVISNRLPVTVRAQGNGKYDFQVSSVDLVTGLSRPLKLPTFDLPQSQQT